MVKRILFVCGHNAGRSQMAQAFFNHLYRGSDMVAESAGTNIAETVQAACVAVMSEIGIDMSDPSTYFPKKIDQSKKYYGVYCMGCQVACPIPLDGDFALDDPAGKSLEEVRIVRDVLKRKVEQLIQELQGERVR